MLDIIDVGVIVGLSIITSYLTTKLFYKNIKSVTYSQQEANERLEFENEEMQIHSTPSKLDLSVVRSKEIIDEERS